MISTFGPPMAFRLLVVDDDLPMLGLLKSILEQMGVEAVTERDSRVAARLVATRKFDGIFLDAAMPHLDGFQLTEAVRKSPSNSTVPIVMLTGSDDVQTMRRGFQAGITLFLGKPLTHERLAHVLNAMRGAFLKEKRRYTRLVYRNEVLCRLTGSSSPPSKLSALDLSEGGMSLMKAVGLNVGQGLDLQFALPGASGVLRPVAKIVRQMPPDGIGVSFVNLSPPELRALQSYISGLIRS
jgi:CheY-like chemotaxis protein